MAEAFIPQIRGIKLTKISALILCAFSLTVGTVNSEWLPSRSRTDELLTAGSNMGSRAHQQSLATMGTGLPVFVGLQNAPTSKSEQKLYRGRSEHRGQTNIRLGENDAAQRDWAAAGARGSALGTIGAPQVIAVLNTSLLANFPGRAKDWEGRRGIAMWPG